MSIQSKLEELNLSLPEVGAVHGTYIPGVKVNGLLFVSGRIPTLSGKLISEGKVGGNLTIEEGYKAAELCSLHCLAVANAELGSLDKIIRIVRITGYVNSAPGFTKQPMVINGASDLVAKLFEERGKHARSAVGVAELPNNAPVEVEMIIQYANLECEG